MIGCHWACYSLSLEKVGQRISNPILNSSAVFLNLENLLCHYIYFGGLCNCYDILLLLSFSHSRTVLKTFSSFMYQLISRFRALAIFSANTGFLLSIFSRFISQVLVN